MKAEDLDEYLNKIMREQKLVAQRAQLKAVEAFATLMHIKRQLGLRHLVAVAAHGAPLLTSRERAEQYLMRYSVAEQLRLLNLAAGRAGADCASPDDLVEALADVVCAPELR